MSQPQLNVKVYFKPGSQVRRIKLNPDETIEDFKKRLIEFHKTSPIFKNFGEYTYQLMYMDEEGDWVTVDAEEDWRDAIDHFLKRKEPLFRVQLHSVNKSLQKINQARKEYQQVVVNRYNDNVKPLIEQLKEYLKDPQKHQEAKEWLVDLTHRIGTQAQEGLEDVQTWINREIPPKVDEVVKELEKMAENIADTVESIGVFPRTPDLEPQQLHEETEVIVVNADPEDFILVDEYIEPQEDHKEEEEPPQVEEEKDEPVEEQFEEVDSVEEPVIEVKEPEFEIPSEYAEAMRSLDEMGFTDKERNLHFLKEFKGDMVKAVSALLSLPF